MTEETGVAKRLRTTGFIVVENNELMVNTVSKSEAGAMANWALASETPKAWLADNPHRIVELCNNDDDTVKQAFERLVSELGADVVVDPVEIYQMERADG